ncbi:MAG: short-chain dehydrogenase [Alphaproteobacteria bacterium]|nr:MAG: short-chain dehydrogenase [Alphaproteobacteria bacterium]
MAYGRSMRLNPVILISGAASGAGAAAARALAPRAQGGLILVGADGGELDKVADSLINPPERVSTLAFDVADDDRWTQAGNFIESQYGRLDWAIVSYAPPAEAETDLVSWGDEPPQELRGAFFTLRALMLLMQRNTQGGAIVITAPAGAFERELSGAAENGLLSLVRMAAKEGAHDNVRINAVAFADDAGASWPEMAHVADLVRETGSERRAFERISHLPLPMARYTVSGDAGRLFASLLADESPMTGAVLVVDGGYAL